MKGLTLYASNNEKGSESGGGSPTATENHSSQGKHRGGEIEVHGGGPERGLKGSPEHESGDGEFFGRRKISDIESRG